MKTSWNNSSRGARTRCLLGVLVAAAAAGTAPAVAGARVATDASSACSDTWDGGSGSWSLASNWIPVPPASDHVPGESDVACIDGGTVSVTNGGSDAGEIDISGGTVDVSGVGLTTYPNGAGDSMITIASGATVNLATNGYLATYGGISNAGTIAITGSGSSISPGITNTGLISVAAGSTQFDRGGSEGSPETLDNLGTIALADGATATATEAVTDDTGGTIAATGSGQLVTTDGYTQGAGTTTDTLPGGFPVDVGQDGSLTYAGSGASDVEDTSGTTMFLTGGPAAGQQLMIDTPNDSTVRASGGADNAGTITVDDGNLEFDGTANTNTGTIAFAAGSNDSLIGDLTNAGTLSIGVPVSFTKSPYTLNPTLDNTGELTIADGATLTNQQTLLDDTGGTIATTGSGQVVSTGLYEQGNGTIIGSTPVAIAYGSLNYSGDGAGQIEFDQSTTAHLSGSLSAGQTLLIDTPNNSEVEASNAFTNAGTIDVEDGTLLVEAPGVLTNAGTLETSGAGPDLIQGSVDNTGLTDIRQSAAITNSTYAVSPTFDNTGQLTIENGATLSDNRVSLLDDTGGTVTLGGATAALGTSFTIDPGATLAGTGTVQGGVTNDGTVAPGTAAAGALAITGNYAQSAGGTLATTVAASGAGTLAVSGSAALGGTLAVTTPGFTPATGTVYTPVTFGSSTGTFATVTGLSSGPYALAYQPTDVTLTVLPPTVKRTLLVLVDGVGAGTVTADGATLCARSSAILPKLCSGSYAAGAEVTLSAQPGSRATFAGWGGACSGSGSCTVTMSQLRLVTAKFAAAS